MTPQEKTQQLIATAKQYFVPNYKPREMILDYGKGARVWDLAGKEYIDLGSGIAVTSFGHQDPDMVTALTAQAGKLWHTSNVYYTEPGIHLAEELVKSVPWAKKVFFCNSGAEANEAAIKLARKYASDTRPPEKRGIVSFSGSFHGRTLATVTATAQPKYQQGFEPLPAGFTYAPYNDFDAIERFVNADVCAVIIEPLQGEGGVTPAKPGFLLALQKRCREVGALLIVDEVQCGVGRTGLAYCHLHDAGVEPDIMTLAKAFGGGFPIGAMVVGEKAQDVFQFGSHGTTFGGNPMACAVARVCLQKATSKDVLANVVRQSGRLQQALHEINNALQLFADIRGRGLMIGAELKESWHGKAGDITEAARHEGALILQAGPNVLRFLPPLTITDEELETGITRLEAGLKRYLAVS